MTDDKFVVVYVDRKHGNAYYDIYRNNWIECAVEHHDVEGRALHLDKRMEHSYVMDMDMKIIITLEVEDTRLSK